MPCGGALPSQAFSAACGAAMAMDGAGVVHASRQMSNASKGQTGKRRAPARVL